jgi:hypothetical protein
MNERFRDLVISAGIYDSLCDPYDKNNTGDPYGSIMDDLEKIAELIIQECFQACMNEGASYEEKAAGAYQSNLYVNAIKKHFGVEE